MPFDDIKNQMLKKSELWSAESEGGKEFMQSETSKKQKINTKNLNRRQDHYIVNQYKVKPDPFESLKKTSKFNLPLWGIGIIAAICILLLLGGLAAIIVAVIAPRKYSTYNQKCDNSTKYCDPSKNLFCSSGLCACANSNFYWSSTTNDCEYKKSYSESCTSSSQCFESYGLTCAKTPTGCNCPVTSVASMCDCASSRYYDESTKKCVSKLPFGSKCTFDNQCLQTISLVCSAAGFCSCPTTQYYKNSKCNNKVGSGATCSSASECDDTKGLTVCSTTCNCAEGFYYETSMSQCNVAKSYGASCTSNSMCDSTKFLTCKSTSPKTCICTGTKTWNYTANSCV